MYIVRAYRYVYMWCVRVYIYTDRYIYLYVHGSTSHNNEGIVWLLTSEYASITN